VCLFHVIRMLEFFSGVLSKIYSTLFTRTAYDGILPHLHTPMDERQKVICGRR
jgi:hypothetical protein